MSNWISLANDRPTANGIYWCYCKVSKKKKWGACRIEFRNGHFYRAHTQQTQDKILPTSRIRAWAPDAPEPPDGLPVQNLPATTNEHLFFKRHEFIGDAIIPAILRHYYINMRWPLEVLPPLVNKATSNYIMSIAGKNAGVPPPPDGIVQNKYYGSAFEFTCGKMLVDEGYDAVYKYVVKYLVPVIADHIPIESIPIRKGRAFLLNRIPK